MISLFPTARKSRGVLLTLVAIALLSACASTPAPETRAATERAATALDPSDLPPPPFEPVVCDELRNPQLCRTVASIRAVNLGNALEAPREGMWGVILEERDFALIAEAGFNAVRIPVRWSSRAAVDSPYRVSTGFFERVDWVLEQARATGLLAILNMHHYDEIFVEPDAHAERFTAIWTQIAERYASIPDEELWFEPLNEPHGALYTGKWNQIVGAAIESIRSSNPSRPIVVGGTNWNAFDAMLMLRLPDDPNLVLTFHYYLPFAFTHQGASWVGLEGSAETPWRGTDGDRAAIDADFLVARSQARTRGLPLFLGEFGAYSQAPIDSRARWTHYVRAAAEANGMGWAYWEWRAGFGVYDRDTGRWNESLMLALLGERAISASAASPP